MRSSSPISTVRRQLALIAAVALFPAISLAQTGQGTLTGRVVSSGGVVAGAMISANGVTSFPAHSSADGSYRLVLPAGRYELQVRAIGFRASRDSVTIVAGASAVRNVELERSITALDAVSLLATRGEARSVIDAPVPIDVLSASDIRATGRTETPQMIQAMAPSFNFPRATVSDGTDHVRPFTLRGLAPDETLVLINGKRRHNSALVNVNGSIGRGSAPVDLNSIPASMIDHIEILRDGAAAQYGSDAIAGVINIVLKSDGGGQYATTVGEDYTTYNRPDNLTPFPLQVGEREARDGKVFQSALDYGWSSGTGSFLHVGAELRDRGYTNRSLLDPRIQYFAGDARETDPAFPSSQGRLNHRQGDAATHDVQGFWNAGSTVGSLDFYSFGGASKRHGEAAGFWRRQLDDRTLRDIYSDGFLPLIASDIWDFSAAVGVKGTASGWRYDLGTVSGGNQFGFNIKNTENASLGPTSPTQFDAGKLRFQQSTTTLDFNRRVRGGLPLAVNVAAGGEFRADHYQIVAGEFDSWRNGGAKVLDVTGQPTSRPAPPGAQVFPGFKGDSAGRKNDAGSHARNNAAAYVDLSADVTRRLLVELAGRYEHYNDFGSTTTGKLSTRYQIVPGLSLRGSMSSGFRAPSLMQEFFSSTATNFVAGVPFDIKTFPASSRAAAALGARPLEAEQSRNYGFGLAAQPFAALSFTADYYSIKVNDRIVLSNNFTGAAAVDALTSIGITGVTGGRYFTNAIDTRTHGFDLIANYGIAMPRGSVLRLSAAYNHNDARVTRVDTLPTNLAGLKSSLFDRVERARIELGNPDDNLVLSSDYTLGRASLLLRTQRFGEVTSFGVTPTNAAGGPLDQTFSPKWITDVSASYRLRGVTASVGADNLFDIYPDRNNNNGVITSLATENGGTSNFGIFPYNGISPFGFNGRFIYAKIGIGL